MRLVKQDEYREIIESSPRFREIESILAELKLSPTSLSEHESLSYIFTSKFKIANWVLLIELCKLGFRENLRNLVKDQEFLSSLKTFERSILYDVLAVDLQHVLREVEGDNPHSESTIGEAQVEALENLDRDFLLELPIVMKYTGGRLVKVFSFPKKKEDVEKTFEVLFGEIDSSVKSIYESCFTGSKSEKSAALKSFNATLRKLSKEKNLEEYFDYCRVLRTTGTVLHIGCGREMTFIRERLSPSRRLVSEPTSVFKFFIKLLVERGE